MPVSYQFLDKTTGQPVSLNQVDREIAEETGFKYSETQYCPWFQLLQIIGMSITLRSPNRCKATEEGFNKFKEEHPDDYTEEGWALIRKYTVDRYTYSCWR